MKSKYLKYIFVTCDALTSCKSKHTTKDQDISRTMVFMLQEMFQFYILNSSWFVSKYEPEAEITSWAYTFSGGRLKVVCSEHSYEKDEIKLRVKYKVLFENDQRGIQWNRIVKHAKIGVRFMNLMRFLDRVNEEGQETVYGCHKAGLAAVRIFLVFIAKHESCFTMQKGFQEFENWPWDRKLNFDVLSWIRSLISLMHKNLKLYWIHILFIANNIV